MTNWLVHCTRLLNYEYLVGSNNGESSILGCNESDIGVSNCNNSFPIIVSNLSIVFKIYVLVEKSVFIP